MHLRGKWSKKAARRLVIAGVGVLTGLCAVCIFFRISRPRDLVAYHEMMRECHPVWREFALRRLGAGDSLAELIGRFPPNGRSEFGRYGVYLYHAGGARGGISLTGLMVVSRDGQLIRAEAASCTWQFAFFDTPDPEFAEAYKAFVAHSDRSDGRD